jgi:Icc-related predicted phosphoesterase
MKKLKVWTISDTHMQHHFLNIPEDIDIVIHAGDSTNSYNWVNNEIEFEEFIYWFSNLPIKYKVLIAGNHDAWGIKKYNNDKIKDLGIIYLDHEYAEIENRLIFGSPYTPTFNNWHFMVDKSKIARYWEALVEGIDILITHGPPKGILDLSIDRNHKLDLCGDSALFKKVIKVKPDYHIFGHIHDNENNHNYGMRTIDNLTKFYNCSVVEDGKINQGIKHNGHIINI